MQELLFLCHRIPYPPNKGDKIRSFNLLKVLAENYRVHLGTFVDDAGDWRYRDKLAAYCDRQCYRPLAPRRARLRSLSGLLRGQALSLAYYRDRGMARWVAQTVQQRPIAAVVAFSSAMGPYALAATAPRRILDFVDVDSEKWRQYAASDRSGPGWLSRRVYAREGRRLLAAERDFAARFDASVFVSEAEADLFRANAPAASPRVHAIGNGVDSDFFDPTRAYADPYAGHGSRQLVFTGAMDYAANVDAVCWFVETVWPRVRERAPRAGFCIVGIRPARRVRELARVPGVTVTGAVADVRPYLAHARMAVAPMRIARGLQNKVLEALAMGTPTVLTPQAATGLRAMDATFARLADTPAALADQVLDLLARGADRATGGAARAYVLTHYDWRRRLAGFVDLVAGRQPGNAQLERQPRRASA